MQLIGFDFVVARNIETDDLVRLAVVYLNPISLAPSPVPSLPDLSKVDDRDWAEARRRLDLIAPLLDGTRSPRAVIVERAPIALAGRRPGDDGAGDRPGRAGRLRNRALPLQGPARRLVLVHQHLHDDPRYPDHPLLPDRAPFRGATSWRRVR